MVHGELPPHSGGLESNSHGYSAQPHSELKLMVRKKPYKMHNKQVL